MRGRTIVNLIVMSVVAVYSGAVCGKSTPVPRVNEQGYISIRLGGDYDFQKVGIGDVDGDGVYEYIIKQPNFTTDPYQQPGYWKKSTTKEKIEAYRLDGT